MVRGVFGAVRRLSDLVRRGVFAAAISTLVLTSVAWLDLATGQSSPPVTGPAPSVLMANGHLPAIRDTTSDLISISGAMAQYGAATASADDPTDPRIISLAANLGNDVDRIYDFVRNTVDFYPSFGLGKGAVGAYLDRDGGAFDQAHLFVELVRASGGSARYVLGTISPTPAQATSWFGPSDARAMCQLLAGAGFPATVNGQSGACASIAAGPIIDVTLLHVWAETQIGGVWYTFDPSFKAYETIASRPVAQSTTIAGIMGMSSGAPWSTLTSGASLTSTSFGNLNHAGLDTALGTWSQNLLAWQAQQETPADTRDIVGGRKLVVDAAQVRQTSHPLKAAGSSTTIWSGDIPNQFRTKLTIAGGGLVWTAYADALAGHRVTIDSLGVYPIMSYGGEGAPLGNPPLPELYLDWHPVVRTDQCLETLTGPEDPGFDDAGDAPCAPLAVGNAITQFMTISVDVPLAAGAGQYLDQQFTKAVATPVQVFDDPRTAGVVDPYVMYPIATDVVFSQGRATEAGLLAYRDAYTQTGYRERTQYSDACIRDGNGEPIPQYMPCSKSFRESISGDNYFVGVASYYLNGESAARSNGDFAGRIYGAVEGEVAQLLEGISGGRLVHHYSVGVSTRGSVDVESRWTSVDGATPGSGKAAFRTLAGFTPAIEAVALRESVPAVNGSAASTSGVWTGNAALRKASSNGGMLVRLSPGDTVTSRLPSYSVGAAALIQNYLDAGFTIAAPENQQSLSTGAGIGFHVVSEARGDIATITIENAGGAGGWARVLKGAAASFASTPSAAKGLTDFTDTLAKRDSAPRAHLGGVDLQSGALAFTEPAEVSMGQGEFPYQLSFQRSFSSEGFADSGGLGAGWTHSYASHLELSTSIFNALGARNPNASSATIAALRAAYEIASSGAIEQSIGIASISDWWFKSSLFNTISTSVGAESEQFVRMADGAWKAVGPSNSTLSFANLPGGNVDALFYPVTNPTATVSRRLSDGSVQTFGAVGKSYHNTPFRLALKSWTFPQGIAITLDYRDSGNLSAVHTPLASLSFDMSSEAPRTRYECTPEGMSVCSTSGQETACVQRRVLCATLEGASQKLNAVSNGTTTVGFTFQDITSAGAFLPDSSIVKTAAIAGVLYGRTYDYALNHTRVRATDIHTAGGHKANFTYTPYSPFIRQRTQTADDALARRYRYQTVGVGAAHVIDPAAFANNPAANHRIARYNEYGRAISNTDELGRTYLSSYDAFGRLSSRVSAYGDSYHYFYNTRHNMVRAEHRPKAPPPGGWGAAGQTGNWWGQTVVVRAENGDVNWPDKPTKVWAPETTEDPTPTPTDLEYYASSGQLKKVTFPPTYNGVNGQTQRGELTFAYDDPYGRPTLSTDPTGRQVKQAYGESVNGVAQPMHCMTSTIVDPDALMHTGLKLTTRQTCDAAGNVTSVIDPRGNTSTSTYDKLRRVTQTDGPAGTNIATRWTFDADGNTTREEKRLGASTWLATDTTYSLTGKPLTVTDPAGDMSRTCYDLLDRAVLTVDPDGRATRTSYNATDQVTLVERWMQPQSAGACVAVAAESPTAPALNAAARLNAQQYRRMEYTAAGLLEAEIDANGNRTDFIYEGLGRVIQTNFADPDGAGAQAQQFELTLRNERGEVVYKRQRNDRWLRYYFDAVGRPSYVYQQGNPGEWVQGRSFSFDLAGRPTMKAVYDCASANCANIGYRDIRQFEIDPAGRTNVEWSYPDYTANPSLTRFIGHGFDAASNRTVLTWPDGFEAHYTFDVSNRMTEARAGTPSGGVISSPVVQATYAYDSLSRRTGVTRQNGANSSYTYEVDSDLQHVAHTTASGGQPSFAFSYVTNPSGQIGSMSVSHAAFQYVPSLATTAHLYGGANALNQQSSEDGNAISWDASGNMSSATLDAGATTFAHDSANRMIAASRSGMSALYVYDADDRRTAKTVTSSGTVTTQTLWSGTDELAEYDGAGTLQRRIIPGPGIDDKVASIETGGGARYFHTDRLGSVVALTDANGATTDTYSYSAYGKSAAALTGNPWRYTGRYLDAETGLYYYRARYYTTRFGQFLETDPIGTKDDPNLYLYVGMDPTNKVDPDGKESQLGRGNKAARPNSKAKLEAIKDPIAARIVGMAQEAAEMAALAVDKGRVPNLRGIGGAINGAIRGSRIHSEFKRIISRVPGFEAEVSYKDGHLANYGDPGSVRADAVFGPIATPALVIELKTGLATLKNSEVLAYERHVPGSPPLYLVHVR